MASRTRQQRSSTFTSQLGTILLIVGALAIAAMSVYLIMFPPGVIN